MKTEKVFNSVEEVSGSVINVEIPEVVLTPFVCASLVNEILKGLLYQKNQIPYPYNWLKNIVNKKRDQENTTEKLEPTNFKLSNHFRVVSNAYDTLECLMKAILREFSETVEVIKEVLIIFGTTPECPKEIFMINTVPVVKGHNERNHMLQLNKFQQKILRRIFLSQNWMDNINNSLTCTNTYLFLKKYSDISIERTTSDQDVFKPVRPLRFSNNVKVIKINLSVDDVSDKNCCRNLSVFSDGVEVAAISEPEIEEYNEANLVWYKSKDFFQGFKDCFVNKTSASELW